MNIFQRFWAWLNADPDAVAPVPATFAPRVGEAPLSRGIVAGLRSLNAAGYHGWGGDCPGADRDADYMRILASREGCDVIESLTGQATRAGELALFRASISDMRAGDALFLYYSGHGGQVPDKNGDEPDGKDETICLYDGQVIDDELASLLCEVPAGVLVVWVSDSCNSGTNFRAVPTNVLPMPKCGVIHIGGCDDGKTSEGGNSGGLLTSTMIGCFRSGMTWREWFDETAIRMPSRQVPVYEEWGNVTDAMRRTPAFKAAAK